MRRRVGSSQQRHNGRVHGREMELAKRYALTMDMRVAGHTLAEIAAATGVSTTEVSRTIDRQCNEMLEERAERLRAVETARLEALHRTLWKRSQDRTSKPITAIKAAEACLKVSARKSKLLGLDVGRDAQSTIAAQVNIQVVQDEHVRLRTAILRALRPHPAALADVMRELERLSREAGQEPPQIPVESEASEATP